jgi:hypothetical protein
MKKNLKLRKKDEEREQKKALLVFLIKNVSDFLFSLSISLISNKI